MEQNKQKVLAEFEKLRKRSQFYFFCYLSFLIAGIAYVFISQIWVMVDWIKGKPTGDVNYGVLIPVVIVCVVLWFVFWEKHKKASDELTQFVKKL